MNSYQDIKSEIQLIDRMTARELRKYWRQHFKNMPEISSVILLRKKLTFLLQQQCYGGYSDVVIHKVNDVGFGGAKVVNPKGITSGTVFSRVWKGTQYRLLAVEDGFMLNGRMYQSLSGAAFAITGTQWSGKTFWKVK